jgi:hypothetical protein
VAVNNSSPKLSRIAARLALGLGVLSAALFIAFLLKKRALGHWPWPLNGELINDSSAAVQVWDDDHGPYEVPAHTRSPADSDVDHVLEPASGRWCKLGPHKVTVTAEGRLGSCPCWSPGAGIDCP